MDEDIKIEFLVNKDEDETGNLSRGIVTSITIRWFKNEETIKEIEYTQSELLAEINQMKQKGETVPYAFDQALKAFSQQ